MAPVKVKPQKMTLGDFLGDKTLGSWADDVEETIPASRGLTGYARREQSDSGSGGRSFGGFSGNDRDERFPPRDQLPIPDKPPYTAHVGNLSFDVSENEISDFFSRCDVSNVRLVRDRMEDRPKGFGYVEFNTKEGLIAAMELNGSQLSGRNVRINVAEPPKDRGDERTLGEWRRTGPLPALEGPPRRSNDRGFGDRDRLGSESGDRPERRQSNYEASDRVRGLDKWERTGPLSPSTPTGSEHGGRPRSDERSEPREFRRRSPAPAADGAPKREYRERQTIDRQPTAPERDNEWRRGARPDPPPIQRVATAPSSPVAQTTRPKLELKKRSEHPVEPALASATSDTSTKPNPFGAARPIDTFQREKEVEEKRQAVIAAKKVKEEKAREDKKVRSTAAGEDDKSRAATPTGVKNFALLRRASGATESNIVDGGGEGEGKGENKGEGEDKVEGEAEAEAVPLGTSEALPEKKKELEVRPSKVAAISWRKAEPKTGTEEIADGWSTVSAKKGRGGSTNVGRVSVAP